MFQKEELPTPPCLFLRPTERGLIQDRLCLLSSPLRRGETELWRVKGWSSIAASLLSGSGSRLGWARWNRGVCGIMEAGQ